MNSTKTLKMDSYRKKRMEESNIMSFIDRLPNIIKQDKVILRNKIRNEDPSLLQIMKKRALYQFRNDDNIKKMEMILKKYLNDFKSSNKQEHNTKHSLNQKLHKKSIDKPHNKENSVEKRNYTIESSRFQKINPKSARSPMSSLQKLQIIKSKKFNQTSSGHSKFKVLQNIKLSIQKNKQRNLCSHSQRSSKSKNKTNKQLSKKPSSSFLTNNNIKFSYIQTQNLQRQKFHQQFQFYPKTNKVNLSQFENLFTAPNILRQCQQFLEQAKQSDVFQFKTNSESSNIPEVNPISPKFCSENNEVCGFHFTDSKPSFSLHQNLEYNHQQIVSFCKQESDSNLLQNNSIQMQKQRQIANNYKIEFHTKTSEFVFDLIFTDQFQMPFGEFQKIINKLFGKPSDFINLYLRSQCSKNGLITIYQTGKILQQICQRQQNYIQDVFSLLDIDKKGHITETDITNFVSQIVDRQSEDQKSILQLFKKVFSQSDFKKNGRVEYWALYFIKKLSCFKEMITYVSQFQFEIQS